MGQCMLLTLTCIGHTADLSKPNIVFIFTDDHSLQTIGAYNARLSAFCRKSRRGVPVTVSA